MKSCYAGTLIALSVLGCVDYAEDDPGTNQQQDRSPVRTQHGFPGSSRVNALTDEKRETLCADSRQKVMDARGTDLEECTAAAIPRVGIPVASGVRQPELSCEERVQACLAAPASIRDAENSGPFPCTTSPFGPWNDECTATVDAYDSCVNAIARYHDERVGGFSCQDEDVEKVHVFVDIDECAALKESGNCGVIAPTSLQ